MLSSKKKKIANALKNFNFDKKFDPIIERMRNYLLVISDFLHKMSIHEQTYKKLSERDHQFIETKKIDDIEKIINEIHPADIADILEILNEKDNDKLKEIIENKKYTEAIIKLDDNVKKYFLSKFSAITIANDLINQLESDDADIILELKDDKEGKSTFTNKKSIGTKKYKNPSKI